MALRNAATSRQVRATHESSDFMPGSKMGALTRHLDKNGCNGTRDANVADEQRLPHPVAYTSVCDTIRAMP